MFEKLLELSFSSSVGRPNPRSWPPPSTATRSKPIRLEIPCAIMIIVWPGNSEWMISCIWASVFVSTMYYCISGDQDPSRPTAYLLVGSSKIRTFPGFSIALERQKSCPWPCERKSASINVSRIPVESKVLSAVFSTSTSHSPTFIKAVTIASSTDLLRGSRLDRTEPGKKNRPCVRHITFSLVTEPGTVAKSTSSMTILSETTSSKRKMARMDELSPLFEGWSASC